MTGWRVALRIAARDVFRARARSLLVVAMIALPVLAVSAALVLQRTSDVSAEEGLDRTLGAAQAEVRVDPTTATQVAQDPGAGATASLADPLAGPLPTTGTLSQLLGGAPVLEVESTSLQVRTRVGATYTDGFMADLDDPLTAGIVRLREGCLPTGPGEVGVNQALVDDGYTVGERLDVLDAEGEGPLVVGVVESTTARTTPVVVAALGTLPSTDAGQRTWLVGGDPVSWSQVQQLNARGAVVVSRAVVLDPPPASEVRPEVRALDRGPDSAAVTVALLVVSMALLEVVLLAGPAFAVGARRLQRTLALLAAAGGTPRQARSVVLAGAVVLGSVASAGAAALGVALAAALEPALQTRSATWFGPFEAPLLPLAVVAALGLLSAVLAAVVPAWIASRQDVVAVLAGRRGDRAPSRRSPVLGAVLLGAGIALAVVGALDPSGGETGIAAAALLSVLGMVLLVPVVVAGVGRAAGRLPLSLRYATRDAARHRTRTVPAVAAVAASVAGVVALLISTGSDAAQDEATYAPSATAGTAMVSLSAELGSTRLAALERRVGAEAPGATVTPVRGVVAQRDGIFRSTLVTVGDDEARPPLEGGGASLGSELLVADPARPGLPPGLPGLSAAEVDEAGAALAAGTTVVFTDDPGLRAPRPADVRLETSFFDEDGGTDTTPDVLEVPALLVPVGQVSSPAAVLPEALADEVGEVATTGLVLTGAELDAATEQAVAQVVAGVDPGAYVQVERGFVAEDEVRVLRLVLLGLGAVLMLGGTITATFLALADARPDLATLAAVGASPRRRRSVAAGYALVVGLVGAVLGALVGAVPGVAVSFPLTRPFGLIDPGEPTHHLAVPWASIAVLVVGLPLLTAALVALVSRSRLPIVARVD